MKNYTVKIQDREAGNEVAKFYTMAEAQKALEKYESDDKEEGNFTPDFYEIVIIDTLAENVKKAGSSKSEAKKAASKENGKLGGRPKTFYIVEIPHQSRASVYAATKEELLRRAQDEYSFSFEKNTKEDAESYGDEIPEEIADILENSDKYISVCKDGWNVEYYAPEKAPNIIDEAIEQLFHDLNSYHIFSSKRELKEYADRLDYSEHQAAAIKVETERFLKN